MRKITKKLLSIALFSFCAMHIHAADIYVSATGDNTNGTTLLTAYNTINQAYNIAKDNSENDNIIISGTVSLTGQITFNDASGFSISFLSADDGYGGTQAIINNGNAGNRLFFANATSNAAVSVFTGLEFENITTALGAGGFFGSNNSSSITFNDCKFTNLSTANAVTDPVTTTDNSHGNISIINTTMTFTDCVFDSNVTLNGNGGVFSVGNGGVLVLTDCLFTGNSSARANVGSPNGGAISVVGSGTANITGTTFYNNSTYQGGAIFMANTGVCTLTNVTMFGNNISATGAGRGGALRAEGSAMITVENSLIYGNYADNANLNIDSDIALSTTTLTAALTNTLADKTVVVSGLTVTDTGSNFNADLDSSSLNFDAASGKVKYVVAGIGDDSPIDFGSDGEDVGAWNSGLSLPVLSLDSMDNLKSLSIYNLSNGNIKILADGVSDAKVYNLLGNCVASFTMNETYELETSSILPGVYILNITMDSKMYVQKFIIH